jgi:hypothetical protein
MRIVIGDPPTIMQPPKREIGKNGTGIEAKVLAVRPPRRRAGDQQDGRERRHEGAQADPVNGKVLVLMTPEGYNLPADLGSGKYRVFLRIVPR